MRLKGLISLILIGISLLGFTQKPIEINTENGLSQNSIMCQYIDHNGFLWIGTQEGLNRFDGKNIKTYRSIPLDSTSISDDFIIDIHGDSLGNIYLATRSGLCYFNSTFPRVTRLYSLINEKSLYHTSYFFCLSPQIGKIFSANSEKIVFHDIINNKQISWESKLTRLNNNKPAVYENGILLFSNDSIMFHFLENGERKNISLDKPIKNAKSSLFFNNRLLLFSDSSIAESFINNSKITILNTLKLNEKIIQIKNNNGLITVFTTQNIYKLNSDFSLKPLIQNIIKGANSFEIINSNTFSIGTLSNGIKIFHPNSTIFQNFDLSNLEKINSKEEDFTVWALCYFHNNFIIGTSRGLFINSSESKFNSLKLPNNLHNKIYTSFCTFNENLILANSDQEIIVLDKNLEIKEIISLKQFEGKNVPFKLISFNDKLIIISSGGIYYLNKNFEIQRYIRLKDLNSNLSEYCLAMFIDSKNNFWFGGTRSLLLSKDNFKNNIYLKHNPTDPNTISHFIVSCFEEWPNNGVLAGTLGGGINLIDYTGKIIKKYNPLPQTGYRVIYSIKLYGNKIWASTNSGIISIDLINNQFRTYNQNDGIKVLEYSQHSNYYLNNYQYFGGVNGFVKFNPLTAWVDTNRSKIIIEDININFKPIDPIEHIEGSFFSPKKIKLFPNDKNIAISPTVIDLIRGEEYKIFYRIIELDEQWIELKNKDEKIFFNYLSPGSFNLEIKALGPNNEPLKEILKIEIISSPPFYLSIWFRSIIFILFSMGLVIVVRQISNRKLRKKLKEVEFEYKIKSEKERISRDLHDNVGSQISYLIWSLDDLEIKASKDQEIDPKKIEIIGDQARETMHQLRDTIWALDKISLSFEEFINKIETLLNRITNGKSRLNFYIQNKIPQGKLILKTTESVYLYRIIQEFSNNTLKYAHAKNLYLNFELNLIDNSIIFEIKDDGIGFELDSSKKKGNGLKNIIDRCNELFKEYRFESKPNSGTFLIIKIANDGK